MTQHQAHQAPEPQPAEPTEHLFLIHLDETGDTRAAKCDPGANGWECRLITVLEKYRHPFRFPPDLPADSTIRALVVAMYRNDPVE